MTEARAKARGRISSFTVGLTATEGLSNSGRGDEKKIDLGYCLRVKQTHLPVGCM